MKWNIYNTTTWLHCLKSLRLWVWIWAIKASDIHNYFWPKVIILVQKITYKVWLITTAPYIQTSRCGWEWEKVIIRLGKLNCSARMILDLHTIFLYLTLTPYLLLFLSLFNMAHMFDFLQLPSWNKGALSTHFLISVHGNIIFYIPTKRFSIWVDSFKLTFCHPTITVCFFALWHVLPELTRRVKSSPPGHNKKPALPVSQYLLKITTAASMLCWSEHSIT